MGGQVIQAVKYVDLLDRCRTDHLDGKLDLVRCDTGDVADAKLRALPASHDDVPDFLGRGEPRIDLQRIPYPAPADGPVNPYLLRL